jgi:L-histidine Nalpha-methyltransferase
VAAAVLEAGPPADRFREEAKKALRRSPKELPSKYFYDEAGSELFARITELPEYYPTRTELGIMARHADEMAAAIGPGAVLVEYGSGRSEKTRLLLDRLERPRAYVPVDIAKGELLTAAVELEGRYPGLAVLPVWADFTAPHPLPATGDAAKTVYFPGSTIGNLDPGGAGDFLHRIAGFARGLLIGVDLKKDPAVLHAAYNDAQGVTAAFNRNLLVRLRRELGAEVDPDAFHHYAFYHPVEGRIEMHLVSRREQAIVLDGERFALAEGETIWTEWSYKYTLEEFADLAGEAGWSVVHAWTDDERCFAVIYLAVGRARFEE